MTPLQYASPRHAISGGVMWFMEHKSELKPSNAIILRFVPDIPEKVRIFAARNKNRDYI